MSALSFLSVDAREELQAWIDERVQERVRELVGEPRAHRFVYGDRELAAYLGWPVGKTQKLSAKGVIPSIRVDGSQRKTYDLRAVDVWLAEQGEQ